jgi:ferredoxin
VDLGNGGHHPSSTVPFVTVAGNPSGVPEGSSLIVETFCDKWEARSSSPDQGFTLPRSRANRRRSTLGRQTPRLDVELGCGKCALSCPHSSKTTQVLLQLLDATSLCQQQVYRTAEWRLLCLHKTRPRDICVLGSNPTVPAPPLPSSRRVLPRHFATRVDLITQNLDDRHVHCGNCAFPPRHAHTDVLRRPVDRLFLIRRSIKGATNNR